jgi:hypothetical protein
MGGDHQTACSALKAAQAGLANSLTWLWVATAVRGNRAPLVEGESFGTAGMGSPAPVGGTSLRGQLAQFLPGGWVLRVQNGGEWLRGVHHLGLGPLSWGVLPDPTGL